MENTFFGPRSISFGPGHFSWTLLQFFWRWLPFYKRRVAISKRIVVRSMKSVQVQKKWNEVQKKWFPYKSIHFPPGPFVIVGLKVLRQLLDWVWFAISVVSTGYVLIMSSFLFHPESLEVLFGHNQLVGGKFGRRKGDWQIASHPSPRYFETFIKDRSMYYVFWRFVDLFCVFGSDHCRSKPGPGKL